MNEHVTPENRPHDSEPTPEEVAALAESIDELSRRFGMKEDASDVADSDGSTPNRFVIDLTPDPATADIIRHILRTKNTVRGVSISSSEPHEEEGSDTPELVEDRLISVDVIEDETSFDAEMSHFFTRRDGRNWEAMSEDSEGQFSDSLSKEELAKIRVLLAYIEQTVSANQ